MRICLLIICLLASSLFAADDLNKLPLAQWSDSQKQDNPMLFLKRLQFEQKEVLFKLRDYLEKQEAEAQRLQWEINLAEKNVQKATVYMGQLAKALKDKVFPIKIADVDMTSEEAQRELLATGRERERVKLRLKDFKASLETVQNQVVLKQKDRTAQQCRVDRTAEYIRRLEQKEQISAINNVLADIEKAAMAAAELDEGSVEMLEAENMKAEGQKEQDRQELDKFLKEFN